MRTPSTPKFVFSEPRVTPSDTTSPTPIFSDDVETPLPKSSSSRRVRTPDISSDGDLAGGLSMIQDDMNKNQRRREELLGNQLFECTGISGNRYLCRPYIGEKASGGNAVVAVADINVNDTIPSERQQVAIKVMTSGRLESEIIREYEITKSFEDSPYIVTVIDHNAPNTDAFIAMELLIGKTLLNLVKDSDQQRLSATQVAELLLSLGSILMCFNAPFPNGRTAHSDFQPMNLKYIKEQPNKPGRFVLIDFGNACQSDNFSANMRYRTGSLRTPEDEETLQAHGGIHPIHHDIFQIASLILFAFTGQRFTVDTLVKQFDIPENISERLRQLLARMLESDIARRAEVASIDYVVDELFEIAWEYDPTLPASMFPTSSQELPPRQSATLGFTFDDQSEVYLWRKRGVGAQHFQIELARLTVTPGIYPEKNLDWCRYLDFDEDLQDLDLAVRTKRIATAALTNDAVLLSVARSVRIDQQGSQRIPLPHTLRNSNMVRLSWTGHRTLVLVVGNPHGAPGLLPLSINDDLEFYSSTWVESTDHQGIVDVSLSRYDDGVDICALESGDIFLSTFIDNEWFPRQRQIHPFGSRTTNSVRLATACPNELLLIAARDTLGNIALRHEFGSDDDNSQSNVLEPWLPLNEKIPNCPWDIILTDLGAYLLTYDSAQIEIRELSDHTSQTS